MKFRVWVKRSDGPFEIHSEFVHEADAIEMVRSINVADGTRFATWGPVEPMMVIYRQHDPVWIAPTWAWPRTYQPFYYCNTITAGDQP